MDGCPSCRPTNSVKALKVNNNADNAHKVAPNFTTAQGGRGKHLAAGAEAQDHNTCHDDDYMCTHAPRRRMSATNTSTLSTQCA